MMFAARIMKYQLKGASDCLPDFNQSQVVGIGEII